MLVRIVSEHALAITFGYKARHYRNTFPLFRAGFFPMFSIARSLDFWGALPPRITIGTIADVVHEDGLAAEGIRACPPDRDRSAVPL